MGRSLVTILPECIARKTHLRRRREEFCPGKPNWPLGITMRALPWAGREPPCACSVLKWAAYPSYSIVAIAWCFLDTLPMMKIWLGLRLIAVYTLMSFSLPYAWWIIIPCSYIQLFIINLVSKLYRVDWRNAEQLIIILSEFLPRYKENCYTFLTYLDKKLI